MLEKIAHGFANRVKLSDVSFEARGFSTACTANVRHLEQKASAFVVGAHSYANCPRQPHLALQETPLAERGFAYEGAAMIATLVDLVMLGRFKAVHTLLSGPGVHYRHLIHVGSGWAYSVLDIPFPRIIPACDPVLRWLALDGFGFHRHFFDSAASLEYLRKSRPGHAGRIRTQGAGRALWFSEGADIERILRVSQTVPMRVRADLWSGVGLACGYASLGVEEPLDLGLLPQSYIANFLQGLVFAGAAHSQSESLPEKTCQLLGQALSIDAITAMKWSDEALTDITVAGQGPSGFLLWQERLQERCRDTVSPLGQ